MIPWRPIVLAAALSLTGCATHDPLWYRAGASQDDFYRDQGQCKAQGFGVASGALLQAAVVFNACMQGKGWRQQG